jgi:transcriptional regulator with XRE-family HTH domain
MEPGILLREARRRSRLSQYEVAVRAGCSQTIVARAESGEREPTLAKFERMLAACGFQLHVELEPLDTTLDQQIEDMAVAQGPTSLYLLSQDLLFLASGLAEAAVPFVVEGVAAAILHGFPLPYQDVQLRIQDDLEVMRRFVRTFELRRDLDPSCSPHRRDISALPRLEYIYDLRDRDAHWLADSVQIRVRTQAMDPCVGAVSMTVHGYKEETTVSVVPLQRIILPRRYVRALERMRQRFADPDIAHRPGSG